MFKPALPLAFDPQLCWRYIPIRGGESLKAYVAGPTCGIQSHHDDFTRPCRAWITDGKIPCWRGKKCVTRFVSYLPLYTCPEEEKVVVILSRSTALKIPALTAGMPITLTRPKGKNNPPLRVSWDKETGFSDRVQQKFAKRPHADIKPYLLHLWQDEMICKHCGVDFVPSRATSEKADVLKISDKVPLDLGS